MKWRDRRCTVQEHQVACREPASWFITQGGYDTYAYCCAAHFDRVVMTRGIYFHRICEADDKTELHGPVPFTLG